MKRAMLCGVLLMCAGGPLLARGSDAAEVAAIKATLAKQTEDWNRGDLDGYATGYKNSADTLFIGNNVRRGYDGMLKAYKTGYPTKESMGVLSFTNEEIHLLDARFADVIGNFHLKRSELAGGDVDGIYSLVMEKTAEGWKIVVDHSALTPPKTGPLPAWEKTVAPAHPCDNPDGHRFDFWIGDWYVTDMQGNHDGDNSVQSLYGGCVLMENWKDVKTYAGKSFNTYDRVAKSWTQDWVDSRGVHQYFTNGMWKDNALVFEGHNPGPKGDPALQRFTFTRVDADHVEQKKEDSLDGGKTYSVTYELHYARKPLTK